MARYERVDHYEITIPFVSLLHRGSCVGWLCQMSAYLQREKEKKDLDELLTGKVF